MIDIFFFEAFEEEAASLRKYLPAEVRAEYTWKTIQEMKDSKPPADFISIRTQSVIPTEWGSSLKGVLTRSTGYDHLIRFRNDLGQQIPCGYLPLYCNRAVAEQAMLLWMALIRKLPLQMQQFQDFKRDGLTGFECENKTLVVVGVGNIGSEIVKIGKGLGMRVLGVDIVKKFDFVNYVSIDEALPRADILVCAMNLTEDNVSYFSYGRLKKSRPGLVFINIARGEMSPSRDLLRLMEEKHLQGLGMDVYNREPELAVLLREQSGSRDPDIQSSLTLSKRDDVIFTPHNAFNTAESVDRKSEQSAQQISHFLNTGNFIWPVPDTGGMK